MKAFGFFFQLTGLILLPSVFLWAITNRIDARTEIAMLAAGAALFYIGSLMNKDR